MTSPSTTDFPARRADGDTRVEIGFFGSASARLFGSLSVPTEGTRAGVIVCSPLHVDFSKNYRNEVLLGWALSRAGLAVLRFHYRGSGHSDGEPSEATLTTLTEDAASAVDWLCSTTGVESLGFIGCRLGALVAAAACAGYVGAPLVLWEPVLDGSTYVREALRARRLGEVTTAGTAPPSFQASMDQLRGAGFVEVHGSPIHHTLLQSLDGRTLAGELGKGPRPIMVIHAAKRVSMRADYAQVLQEWTAAGHAVEVRRVPHDMPWWFSGGRAGSDPTDVLAREAIAPTVEWLSGRIADLERR